MRAVLGLLLAFGWAANGWALSYGTYNGSAANTFAQGLELCRFKHGELPKSWAEYTEYTEFLHRSPDDVFESIVPTKRYAFLNPPARIQIDDREADVLLIMRSPFRDISMHTSFWGGTYSSYRVPGRYLIYRQLLDDSIRYRYLPETEVQKLFLNANAKLPEPDTLGRQPHEPVFWIDGWMEVIWTATLVLTVLLGYGLFKTLRVCFG